MKKKILFVTESLARGGMERVLVDIANALTDNGYNVTIITYSDATNLKNDLHSSIVYKYVKRKEWPLCEKIPYIRRLYRKNYKQFKWETNSSSQKLYKYYVKNEKYDVEIGFYRGPSIKIISGSTNKSSKKIAWVHTDLKLCDPKSMQFFFHDMDEVRKAYGSFNHVVCVSEMAMKSFLEVIGYKGQCSVIYNMVPINKIQLKGKLPAPQSKRRFTIATLGRLIPDKGYDRLLKAVSKVNNEGFSFDVWMIGGGRAENDLKNLAKDLNLENVYFWGMQENPYPLIKQADLFICTSKREGFNIAIVEAMVFGVPVISTRCTGPTEILENGKYGILVDNSEEGVYWGVKQALSNPEGLCIFKEKSLERCWFFDESRIIDQIISLIEA